MSETSQSAGQSQRFGGWLSRASRALLRQEIRFTRWLIAQGMPTFLAKSLLWLLKIALVVLIGYALVWLAVALIAALIAVRILGHAYLEAESDSEEWRHGPQGFGLYKHNGDRVIPYDPTEDP